MRNFGLSNVTSRPKLGAQPSTGSHLREELTRNSIIQLADHVPPDLTPDLLRARLAYDADTGIFTWKMRPSNSVHIGDRAGSIGKKGYLHIRVMGQLYQAHRLAWFYVHGVWPANLIDHRDGNPANNAISNLREATRSQNQANSIKNQGYSEKDGKFYVYFIVDGCTHYFGCYATKEEAREVYLREHARLTGEYSGAHRAIK